VLTSRSTISCKVAGTSPKLTPNLWFPRHLLLREVRILPLSHHLPASSQESRLLSRSVCDLKPIRILVSVQAGNPADDITISQWSCGWINSERSDAWNRTSGTGQAWRIWVPTKHADRNQWEPMHVPLRLQATSSLSIPHPLPPEFAIVSTSQHIVLPISRLHPSTCEDSWRTLKRVKRSPHHYKSIQSGTFDTLRWLRR